MTLAIDHPAATHDAVALIGIIRAAIVAAVIGRTEADREARAEPAPTAMAMPATMPAATMPSGFGGSGQGRYGNPNGGGAAATMAILRRDVCIIGAAPRERQPERSMAGDETRFHRNRRPAVSGRCSRRGGAGPDGRGIHRGCAFRGRRPLFGCRIQRSWH